MQAKQPFEPRGVIPACLLPFNEDLSIDEVSFRKHLRDVTSAKGISAITVNAHSTEVGCCSFEEQQQILRIAVDEVGASVPVVGGVFTESSMDAARIARMSEREGASALLVFPPSNFAIGSQTRPEIVVEHYRRIADATSLPLIYFQFPISGGFGLTLPALEHVIDEIPSIRAVKDFSNDPVLFEKTVRSLQSRAQPVHVLTTHTAWLFASLVLGCNGILSGSGSTVAALQVELFEAVQRNDLLNAKRVADRLFPINSVFYDAPFLDMHNRMKHAQVMLGRLPRATVRPPLLEPGQAEVARIRSALLQAELLSR